VGIIRGIPAEVAKGHPFRGRMPGAKYRSLFDFCTDPG